MRNIRQFENLHIILWLIKDTCWLLQFKTGGVVMIVPTVSLAVHLAWKTRKNQRLFLPNLAVCMWIFANATWMLGEFFLFEFTVFAFLFFCCGMAVLALYFIRQLVQAQK